MSRKKKFAVAAATFSVALGIGFVMQNGDALASRIAPEQPAPEMAPIEVAAASTLSIPNLSSEQVTEAVPMIEMISLTDDDAVTAPLEPIEPAVVDTCEITMEAQTLPLAMVSLSTHAPCSPSEYVTFHHQGMMFKEMTDAEGRVDLIVPALAEVAFYLMSAEGGKGSATSALVPEFVNVDRAVLQWQGINAVQLHALEFGADYGADGHIWSAAAGELDFVAPSQGGFLVTLGNPDAPQPVMAEVYTFPTGTSQTDGIVALSVEAEITADNCGREVAAQSIQFALGQAPEALDLTMTMPDCGTIGEFLVLKNMFKDLTLASK